MVATVQPSIPVDTIPIPEQPDSDSYSPGSSFPTETQEEYRRRNNIDLSGVLPLAVTGATVVGLGTLVVSTLPREGDHYEGYVDEGSLEWRSQRAFYTAGALTGSGIVASLAQSAYKGQADYVDGPLDVVQTVSYIGGSSFLAAGAFMAEAEDPTSRDGLGIMGGAGVLFAAVRTFQVAKGLTQRVQSNRANRDHQVSLVSTGNAIALQGTF